MSGEPRTRSTGQGRGRVPRTEKEPEESGGRRTSARVVVGSIAALLVLVAALAAVAWFFPLLKVTGIEVTGATRTDPEIVEEVSGIAPGDNLLRVDATGAARNIVELPWVASVTVDRVLPGTVAVTLVEREAVIYVPRADGDHVIDSEGRPIIIGQPPFGTVQVTGTDEEDPEVLPAVISVVEAIRDRDPGLTGRIDSIEARDQFDILIRLTDGREVYWGSAENNPDKAVALSTVITREGQHWNISSPTMVTVR